MGLHVRKVGVEECLGPLDRQPLSRVHVFAAPIVAAPRVALGVLVGQHRTLGLEHAGTGEILRADQFDVLFLAAAFAFQRMEEFLVEALNPVCLIEH